MSNIDSDATIALLKTGDHRSIDRVRRQWDESDRDTRTTLIDIIAGVARTGAVPALDLLLELIDSDGLGTPAIRSLLVDSAAVDEVEQDLLVAVANSITSFRGDSAFSTWLYAVAQNQAKLFLRRQTQSRKQPETPPEGLAQRVSSIIADRAAVSDALDDLPEAYRDAVILRDVERYSYAEISGMLSIELNTVRSRISRGRALVAANLGAL